jgi:hypothetical protein
MRKSEPWEILKSCEIESKKYRELALDWRPLELLDVFSMRRVKVGGKGIPALYIEREGYTVKISPFTEKARPKVMRWLIQGL